MENIIIALKNRDKVALEVVIKEYGKLVATLVYRIIGQTGCREDIEECTSDVFAAVWRDIADFDNEKGNFKTWILIKTKYKALDYRRKLVKDIPVIQFEEEMEVEESLETKVLDKEACREILKAIDSVGEPDAEIFKRRYFLYEDIESIADSMKLTKKAVYNRLSRTRNKLRALLEVKR